MIPWIKEKYPLSTFYIFGKFDQIEPETMKTITSLDYVFVSPRISQEQLSIELKKSDVWLYPTLFSETYCISAVEAMAAGCLVASVGLAALEEIVTNRGVVVAFDNDREQLNKTLFTELCRVLDDSKLKEELTERGNDWALKQDFHSLALEWIKDIFK